MSIESVPFQREYLAAAADLLAARHRNLRVNEPSLPRQFEDPAVAAKILQSLLDRDEADGLVALRGRRVVGFLVGTRLISPGRSLLSIPYEGSGAERGGEAEIFRAMYAAIAAEWVAEGWLDHVVSAYKGEANSVEVWFSLGFGQYTVTGVRETIGVTEGDRGAVEVREAELADVDEVVRLEHQLRLFQAGSPMFVPYAEERRVGMRKMHERQLGDETNVYWLALRQGRAVGYQQFSPVPLTMLHLPESCVYIEHAFTESDERGSGVATALLARGMTSAQEAGYRYCATDWVSSNLLASSFWPRRGFRPTSYTLRRRVGEEIDQAVKT